MSQPVQQDRLARGPRSSLVHIVLLACCGIALAVAFERDWFLPVPLAVVLLFAVTLWSLLRIRLWAASPLTRLMILLYFMPFSVCWGHVFDENYAWWYTPLSQQYMANPVIVAGMVTLGLIGLLALLTGLWTARLKAPRELLLSIPPPGRTLHPISFGLLLMLAVGFSYISTPDETIFSSIYTAAAGLAGQFNFNASSIVAYMLLALLWIDTEQEALRPQIVWYKRLSVLAATGFILVFFQILRGDRDSFGLVVALAGLYVTEPKRTAKGIDTRTRRERYVIVGASGSIVLAAFLAITTLRTRVAEGESTPLLQAIVEGYQESTWGSVLLTNLSLAAQYHEGRMERENGLTYLDYLYSLPPGFLTRAAGIERPIEPDRGPNFWFTDVSSGGVHIVAVPFKNFATPGVLVVLGLFGYLIGRAEIGARHPRWINRLWYAAFYVGSAQWFWYGDMPFIRALMACGVAAVLYYFSTRALGLTPPLRTLTLTRSVSEGIRRPSPGRQNRALTRGS